MPQRIATSVCRFLIVLLPLSASAETVKDQPKQSPTAAFLDRYCAECHDSDTHKGGLNLEKLTPDLSESKNQQVWENIFDHLQSGAMPPAKATQPEVKEREQMLSAFEAPLREASLARQKKQGRVVLRRLSRSQYEDTLRDLLDLPALELKDLLPEESLVAGFDNISAAQSISSTHLVRYQQAADAALSSAIPVTTFKPVSLNVSGREFYEIPQKQKGYESHKCWVRGEAMMVPSNLNRPYYSVAPPPAPADGRYRISLTGYGLNTDGKTLPVSFNYMEHPTLQYGKDLDWRDLPPDVPKTVTVDLTLKRGQSIDLIGWTLPPFLDFRSKVKETPLEQWSGPTLVIEHLKMEGPLDKQDGSLEIWPPRSYQQLFGNLPLKTELELAAERDPKQRVVPREKRTAEAWSKDPLMPQTSAPIEDATQLLRAFLPKAFRRPVSGEVVQHYT
ncbi:MAG: Protein of unknown function (DUF1587)/Planctomycete cytochrome C, partial [Verrucomicrobia bacterium]